MRSTIGPLTHTRSAMAAFLALVALAACSDAPPLAPTGWPNAAIASGRGSQHGASYPAEAEFFRLTHLVPGFGGYYFDEHGNIRAYITDLARAKELRRELQRTLNDRTANRPRGSANPRIIVRQGRYDFLQLAAWRDGLFRSGAGSMHSVGVDEGQNAVRVGVSSGAIDEIIAIARGLGVPAPALRIDVSAPEKDLQTP